MIDFLYDILIQRGDDTVKVLWGESPGWLKQHGELLDQADHITLLPKDGVSHVPVVTVKLDQDKRWKLTSRVYGRVNSENRFRCYAIGWQSVDQQVTTWIYPSGAVEVADEPSFANTFLE